MAISSLYDITSPLTPLLTSVTSSTNNISSQLRSWCCGEVWYEKEGDTQAPTSWCADFLRASCWQDSLPCWLSWDYFHSALPFCKCIILLGKSHPLIETINCPFIDLPHNCLVKLLFTLPQGKSHGVMNQVKVTLSSDSWTLNSSFWVLHHHLLFSGHWRPAVLLTFILYRSILGNHSFTSLTACIGN